MNFKGSLKWWGGGLASVVILFVIASLFVKLPFVSAEQNISNRNIGEIFGSKEVGQIFYSSRSNLSGFAFEMATYGGRTNDKEVIFELRNNFKDGEPLRTVKVNAKNFGDHQFYEFLFTPISDSAGKNYYASLRSPESVSGNAITVLYQNSDIYKKNGGSLVVLREKRNTSASLEGVVKPNSDLTFRVYNNVPLLTFVKLVSVQGVRDFISSVRSDTGSYILAAKLALISLVLILVIFLFNKPLSRKRQVIFWLVIGLIGLGLRYLFIKEMPYTNDEGSYLYDARTLLEGNLPGGDALAKTPIFIAVLSGAIAIMGHLLLVGRIVSMVAGLLTAIPLYFLGKFLGGKRVGTLTAAIWLLSSAPALFNSYGHAQSLQILFISCSLWLLAIGIDKKKLRWFLISGLLLGCAVIVRKSSLALGLPVLVMILFNGFYWKEKIKQLINFGIGLGIALGIFLGIIYFIYGPIGLSYATGISLAKTSFEQLSERGDLYATYSVKGVLPFFREALVIIFLGLIMLGQGLERAVRRFGFIAQKLVWIIPVWIVIQIRLFTGRYEGEAHLSFGVGAFLLAMQIVLIVLALVPWKREKKIDEETFNKVWMWIGMLWFVSVAIFYSFWIKFAANYIAEFLPGLVIASAFGCIWILNNYKSKLLRLTLAILIFWAAFSSSQSSYRFEHTGTFHWSSIVEASDFLKKNVPLTEKVQTGAVIIPYLSGHHVPNDVSHPTWYGYGYIEPWLRNVFMASSEKMIQDTFKTNWFVQENVTEFSYFLEYPQIKREIDTKFEKVKEIENFSNTIEIFKRH